MACSARQRSRTGGNLACALHRDNACHLAQYIRLPPCAHVGLGRDLFWAVCIFARSRSRGPQDQGRQSALVGARERVELAYETRRPNLVRRFNPSEASPPYLFCSFACFVSSIPGSFLLDLQRCFALALFGHEASLGFLCFALSLRSEFGGARSLFSLFRLTQFFSAFALSSANRTRLV